MKRRERMVPTLLVTKNWTTFRDPRSIFPGPCSKPVMFKYSNKKQLGGLGSVVRYPSCKSIFAIPTAQKTYLVVATITAIFVCRNMSIGSQKTAICITA